MNSVARQFSIAVVDKAKLSDIIMKSHVNNLSQNAKRASARKDTGLDQSLFSVQLFRLRINIMKVCKGSM